MDKHTVSELAYKKGYEQGKQDAMKWIPVTERLPEICEPVLVCYEFMGGKVMRVTDRYGKDGKIWAGLYNGEKPTHWMPLPEPPTTCHMTSKQQPPKGE